MSILKAFIKAFEKKEERGWDKIYVFVDVHETVLYPTYELNGEKRFYPHALDTLREIVREQSFDDVRKTSEFYMDIEKERPKVFAK